MQPSALYPCQPRRTTPSAVATTGRTFFQPPPARRGSRHTRCMRRLAGAPDRPNDPNFLRMGDPGKQPRDQQHPGPDLRLQYRPPDVRPGGVWASHSDWQAHRPIISYLYCDRHMTLKEVKATMERQYRFFSTERVYKYRFKQWGLAKYTKHPKPGDNVASPASSAIPRPLIPPANLRVLDACLSHLRAFLRATCGGRRNTTRFDPSYEMYRDRASWAFSVNGAVLDIHRGRLSAGFRKLNAAFTQFRHSLVAHDTGFPLKLVSTLAMFTDSGLPGLDTIFLRYAYHCLCIVLSPAHPFSTLTRLLLAAANKRRLDAAWFILAKYSDMLWQCSAPGPPRGPNAEPAPPSEPAPDLLELSWDVARSVDREFVLPLAAQAGKVEWLPDPFSVAMAVAQIHLAQRLHAAARRTVDGALAHCRPGRDPLDTALAYRKRWQIGRAEGRDRAAVDADARAFLAHCRSALGVAHYATARALEEYEGYLGERRAAGGAGGEDTPVPDGTAGAALERATVLGEGMGLHEEPSSDSQGP